MRRDPTLLSLLLVTLTAPAAWAAPPADEGAWTLLAASRTRWVRDGSYDLLSGDDVLPVLEAGVALRLRGGLSLSLAYQGGAQDGSVLGSYRLELRHHAAVLGLAYERPVAWDWLRPFVRGEVGATFGRLGVTWPDATSEDAYSWALGARYHLGAGLRWVPFSRVHTSRQVPSVPSDPEARPKPGLSFGLDLELGYSLATDLAFDDLRRPDVDEDPEPISRRSLALGSLDLSGVELRVGALMRF